MTPAAPRYLSAASSDQGHVRGNNEDRVHSDDARGIYVVIDGMGGHEAGEHAADIALERIRARLERQTGTVEQRVREAIALANNAIFEAAQSKPEWKGMACVLTVAVIEEGQVTAGHVGDSRLYRIRKGSIEKITHDHSPVGEREDRGELTESDAMQHPRRNEVYRDVGSEEHTPDDEEFIELRQLAFAPDSALLLCSDGLSDAISSKEILRIVEQNAGDRWAAVRALIAAATERGKDNVSAILVEGAQFATSFGRRPARQERRSTPTDPPAAETTGRLLERSHTRAHTTGWLWLAAGVVLGAAAGFGVQRFVLEKTAVPAPQVIAVAANGSIAAALAGAHSGDTISVDPGTYRENLVLRDGIDVTARRAHETILEGTVTAANIGHARLEGLQIHGAVRIADSDIVLSRDDVSGSATAGIQITGNARGAIIACTIEHNAGPGIIITDSALPEIENNVIAANGTQPHAPAPGLFVRSQLRPKVTGNVFTGNGAEAIWLSQADPAIIDHNFFIVSAGAPRRRPLPPVRIVPPDRGRP